jgi:hypothetical protein
LETSRLASAADVSGVTKRWQRGSAAAITVVDDDRPADPLRSIRANAH